MSQAGKAAADPSAPVVVVGGGIVGLSCALALARAGRAVQVLDDAPASAPASWGNAGHLASEQVDPIASPAALRSAPARLYSRGGALAFRPADIGAWLPWSLRYLLACRAAPHRRGQAALTALLADALPAWRRLAEALGAPALVDGSGHYLVWESPASAARGLAAWRATPTGTARFEPMAPGDLAALAGTLARPLHGGIRFHDTGQVASPGAVLAALRAAIATAGGALLRARAHSLSPCRAGIRIGFKTGETLDSPVVLVAAGVGSGPLMRATGHVTPLIAERGYHVEGIRTGWDGMPPVVFEDRSMIVTRFGDRLRAASFVEFGRAGSPADPGKWARLTRHAGELGLPLREPVPWMGCRPTLPDYLPAIGVSRRVPGLAYAFGHQHLGLTLAATTAELVGAMLGGSAPRIDLAPFDLARFG